MLNVKVYFSSTAGGVEYKKIYTAKMKIENGTTSIFYDDLDDNGITKTEITIVGKDFVTVDRKGQFSNYLEFKKDYAFSGQYLTPYGKIAVEAYTRFLSVEYNDDMPRVCVKYKSSLMGEVSENEFSLKVRRI